MIDFSFFTDPVLRAPTIGSMLMCMSAALVGVIVFLRKQSLIGEALSHAAYPGVILGIICAGSFLSKTNEGIFLALFVIIGAFLSALTGYWVIRLLERKLKLKSDSAMCFTLASFFGVGLTLASYIQFSFTNLFKQAQIYLYGQSATMSDIHIAIYAIFTFIIVFIVILFYKELQAITFDPQYAKSIGLQIKLIDALVFISVVTAIVIGIRSVGVVLMSAMLITPAVSARQYSNKLINILILAAIFGLLSGFFGNYFSVTLSKYLSEIYPSYRLNLPTGPMIVLVAALICIFSLLFAPERGFLIRVLRMFFFRYKCIVENILKAMSRCGEKKTIPYKEMAEMQNISSFYLKFIFWRLFKNGLIVQINRQEYQLTDNGKQLATKIVHLHYLWELYLSNHIGTIHERMQCSAEEMEHIITPELEEKLVLLLQNPTHKTYQPSDRLGSPT